MWQGSQALHASLLHGLFWNLWSIPSYKSSTRTSPHEWHLGKNCNFMSFLVLLSSECGRTDPFVPCASCITCIDLFSLLLMFSCRVFRQQGEVGGRPNPPREQWPALAAVSLISRLHSLCIFCPTQPTAHRARESGTENSSLQPFHPETRETFLHQRGKSVLPDSITAHRGHLRPSWKALIQPQQRVKIITTISSLRWNNPKKNCTDTPLSPRIVEVSH